MESLETSSMRQADSDSELDSESLSARDRGRQHLRQAFSSIELTLTRSLWTLSMSTQSDPGPDSVSIRLVLIFIGSYKCYKDGTRSSIQTKTYVSVRAEIT